MDASTEALLSPRGWRRRTPWALVPDADLSFKALVDSLPHLVWVARADGRIDYRNGAWRTFAGQHIAVDSFVPLIHPDDEVPFLNAWEEAVAGRLELDREVRVIVPETGDSRRYLFRAVPLGGAHPARWLCSATDVHDLAAAAPALAPARPAQVRHEAPLMDVEAAGARARLATLSERERELLDLLVAGCSNKQAARRLDIAVKTVENHRAKIMRKMEAGNTAELVRVTVMAQ